uniref:DNA repair protein rad9 n=1 Tax=Coccidioides posadasii RMSCC 3488 TaxID=454284 RepID=A0A0J6ICA1_COCPO|nr:DNA repair protein rad9, variant [Coccidioides posadasii RMSCC 3488]
MASLWFSLVPEAFLKLHDVLVCLAKFNDAVSIEAEHDVLRLSTLNPSKSGYASFKFDSGSFFSQFSFDRRMRGNTTDTGTRSNTAKLSCQLYIKALLSVFKGRTIDFKDKDTAVEECKVQIFDGLDETECRVVIQIICKHGVVKTYKLIYEPVEVQHAVFDKSKTQNKWVIDSKFLREIVEYFGPTAEQLDIFTDNGKAIFTSFTTRVTNGKEILKQPVHTSVAIDTRDFESHLVEERLHVAISVKDFKAIIMHADTLKTMITARYTRPCRPLQFSYESGGMTCEFTLMTRGETEDIDVSSNGDARELSARSYSRPPQTASVNNGSTAVVEHGDPSRNESAQASFRRGTIEETPQETPAAASALLDPNSLFVPMDDDRQWDEPQYGDEQEDILGWDASINHQDVQPSFVGTIQDRNVTVEESEQRARETESTAIPPTQRISQVCLITTFRCKIRWGICGASPLNRCIFM